MLLALKLLASGALEAVLKGLSAALNWLLSDWRHLAIAAEAAMLGWLLIFTVPGLRSDVVSLDRAIVRVTLERDAEQAAHLGTVNAFLEASKQAQRDAEANVVRVRAEQEKITHEALNNYRADLGSLRARFDRLRNAAGRAAIHPGHADAAGLSGSGDAAGRAADAAPDHDLPAAGALSPKADCPIGLVCLSIDEAEDASEDAHRHNRLIDWVIGQSAVRFTPVPEPGQ